MFFWTHSLICNWVTGGNELVVALVRSVLYEQRARTLFLNLSASVLGGCAPHHLLFTCWWCNIAGEGVEKGVHSRWIMDGLLIPSPAPLPSPLPPAQCDPTPRLNRPKEVQAVVYLGLTKDASDPERCHHLCQASSGLVGLTLKKDLHLSKSAK